MSLTDVIAKTTIDPGFGEAGQNIIVGVITKDYNISSVARAMFDNWIAAGNTIDIKKVSGVFQAYPGTGRLEIDLSYLGDLSYISSTGQAVLHTPLSAITHELGHALTGKRDNFNVSASDFEGDNVRFVNTIFKQLGLPEEISYVAQAYSDLHKIGYQYTNGTAINGAVTSDTHSVITIFGVSILDSHDTSTGSTNDLLIGGPSDNKLLSGGGNDFLVGAGGSDLLNGGADTDTAVYFGQPSDYDIREDSGGSWTVRAARGAKNEGTDTLKNIEKIQFGGGKAYDLKKNGLTFETDFALVIDTTGSMGSSIGSVKAQASALIDAAFADGKTDARFAVVGFKDTTNGEPSSILLNFTDQDDFAARKNAALTAISTITVGGGGDTPETDFDGLRLALTGLDWRPGAGALRIALFTDAPAKDGDLAAAVTALAHSIGATITAHTAASDSLVAVDTFSLARSTTATGSGLNTEDITPLPFDPTEDVAVPPDITTAQVQIYTIFVGPTGTDTTPLQEIAKNNGGKYFNAPTNEDLINALQKVITAPVVPAPINLALADSSDSGVKGDGITKISTPTITGSGEAGDTVTLYEGTVILGTGIVGSDGIWTITSSVLADGTHSMTADERNSSGDASVLSAGPTLSIMTSLPAAPAVLALSPSSDSGNKGDGVTNVTEPVITGTGTAGDAVTLYDGASAVGTATVGSDGTWSITTMALTVGAHTLAAVQADVAANVSAASSSFSLTINSVAIATLSSGGTVLTKVGDHYVFNLGTVARGGASLTAEFAALNSAVDPADLLGGSYTVAGAAGFTNSGFKDFTGTAAGTADAGGRITLNTGDTGTFSETITLHPIDASTDTALADETVEVTGIVTPLGGGEGDVHMVTFDGLHYDFQAIGDFVLARSSATVDFSLQMRTEAYQNIAGTSVATEIAARAGNDVIRFFSGGGVSIDGLRLPDLIANNSTIHLSNDGTLSETGSDSWRLTWKTGEVLDISDSGDYLNFSVALGPHDTPGSVEGLLGSNLGQASDFRLPDGTILPQPVSTDEILGRFADAWRPFSNENFLDQIDPMVLDMSSALDGSVFGGIQTQLHQLIAAMAPFNRDSNPLITVASAATLTEPPTLAVHH